VNTRVKWEVRQILGPIDPAPQGELVPGPQREADLRRILTTPAPQVAAAARPRRLLIAIAVAAVVAAAMVTAVVGLQIVPLPQPAYAATPPPLAYTGGGGPARPALTTIAERAASAPGPEITGDHEHLVTQSWQLWTEIDGERVRSAVVPTRTESWRGPDNSGRVLVRNDEPQFPAGSDRMSWRLHGSPGDDADPRREDYPAGRFPATWPGRPPATGLAAWLRMGHPTANGPAETLVAAADLARERVLSPAVRAQLLRTVAALPGLRDDGEVTDRAGRRGHAVSLVSDYSGLPTRYTLIVDPVSGALLGFESMLTTSAGKLDVRAPAVIGYESFLVATFSTVPA
jgi:hypothetical protein